MQPDDSNASPPKRIYGRRYQVDATLGSGAMGDVFAARHLLTGQRVALKVLHPHVARHMPSHERFLREVRVAARIEHPDVVQVFDAAVEDGEMFFAMELLEGQTFAAWWAANPGATERALGLIRQALEPLAAAHAAGVVHRDIKPDNLFVVDADRPVVKLIDFGIARDDDARKATQTGLTVGTPFYMSPEQALDPTRCAPTADVWSVGVMLYEALAGRLPFEGPTAQAVCMRMLSEKHRPLRDIAPQVDPAIAAVVERCLGKRPAERPANARALADLLDEALGDSAAVRGAVVSGAGASPPRPAGAGAARGHASAHDAPGSEADPAASADPTEPALPRDGSRARWVIVGLAAALALAAAFWPAPELADRPAAASADRAAAAPTRPSAMARPPAPEPAARPVERAAAEATPVRSPAPASAAQPEPKAEPAEPAGAVADAQPAAGAPAPRAETSRARAARTAVRTARRSPPPAAVDAPRPAPTWEEGPRREAEAPPPAPPVAAAPSAAPTLAASAGRTVEPTPRADAHDAEPIRATPRPTARPARPAADPTPERPAEPPAPPLTF